MQVSVQNETAEFNHLIEFAIAVCDLPRMAKLCLSISTRAPKKKRGNNKVCIVIL